MKKQILSTLLTLPLILSGLSSYASNDTVVKITKTFADSNGEACTLKVMQGSSNATTIDDLYYLDEGRITDDGVASFNVALSNDDDTYTKYNYILTSESGEVQSGSFSTGKRDTANEAYYVVDDDIYAPCANSTDPIERFGWDVLETGAPVTNDSSTDFIAFSGYHCKLKDTSTTERTAIRRTFERQTGSRVTVEYRIMGMEDISDGVGVDLCDGDDTILAIQTKGGALNANGVTLMSVSTATVYGVRVDLNLQTKLCDIYVNGVKRGTNVALAGSGIDNLRVHTSVSGTGAFDVLPYRVHRGYYVADEFVPYSAQQSLSAGTWTTKTSGGTLTIQNIFNAPGADYYCLRMNDTSTSNAISISKDFDNISGQVVFTFKAYSANDVNNLLFYLSSSVKMKLVGGMLQAYDINKSAFVNIMKVPSNLWNTYRVCADLESGYGTIQVNGKEVATDFRFAKAGTSITKLIFQTGTGQTEDVLLDDIYVSEDVPLPDDYPTEPQKLNKDLDNDIVVGMQTCDLWHEGKHFGWDKLVDYPSRRPYLGYFDDGSIEVKDWEIKWMVEHGIDYSIHCWYRPGTVGVPIKEPRNGYSIHDGYFNAKYKDKIKFAIAFENGGWTKGSLTEDQLLADFKDNIVPYWFAYYFSDPNYLTIDNKLVVNIYNLNTMKNNLGEANTAEAISYLRQQAVDAGFAGVYLIGTSSSAQASNIQPYADYGYDAIYAYSYGTNNITASEQIAQIDNQGSQTIISYIPTIAMGRDDSAWNRTSGGFTTPWGVQKVCQHVKDKYFPNGKAGNALGERMVVIDNWNEFGEGHFFMPSNLAGFGYLEAVGNVFGAPAHTDTVPEDTTRLCRLFDANRTADSREGDVNLIDWRWKFDSNNGGFTKGGALNSFNQTTSDSRGVLYGEVSWWGYNINGYKDPTYFSPDNLSVKLTNDKAVHMVYRNKSDSTTTKLYYITNEDTTWNEAKSIQVSVTANMTDYTDIYFRFSGKQLGTLKQLRFDPFENMQGAFYVDYAEIIEPTLGTPLAWIECSGFNNSDGKAISSVPAEAGDASVTFTYSNPFVGMMATGMVGEYDIDGSFVRAYMTTPFEVIGADSVMLTFSTTPGHSYRAFLWNDYSAPITTVAEIK